MKTSRILTLLTLAVYCITCTVQQATTLMNDDRKASQKDLSAMMASVATIAKSVQELEANTKTDNRRLRDTMERGHERSDNSTRRLMNETLSLKAKWEEHRQYINERLQGPGKGVYKSDSQEVMSRMQERLTWDNIRKSQRMLDSTMNLFDKWATRGQHAGMHLQQSDKNGATGILPVYHLLEECESNNNMTIQAIANASFSINEKLDTHQQNIDGQLQHVNKRLRQFQVSVATGNQHLLNQCEANNNITTKAILNASLSMTRKWDAHQQNIDERLQRVNTNLQQFEERVAAENQRLLDQSEINNNIMAQAILNESISMNEKWGAHQQNINRRLQQLEAYTSSESQLLQDKLDKRMLEATLAMREQWSASQQHINGSLQGYVDEGKMENKQLRDKLVDNMRLNNITAHQMLNATMSMDKKWEAHQRLVVAQLRKLSEDETRENERLSLRLDESLNINNMTFQGILKASENLNEKWEVHRQHIYAHLQEFQTHVVMANRQSQVQLQTSQAANNVTTETMLEETKGLSKKWDTLQEHVRSRVQDIADNITRENEQLSIGLQTSQARTNESIQRVLEATMDQNEKWKNLQEQMTARLQELGENVTTENQQLKIQLNNNQMKNNESIERMLDETQHLNQKWESHQRNVDTRLQKLADDEKTANQHLECSLKDQWKTHQRHLEEGQQRLINDTKTATQQLKDALLQKLAEDEKTANQHLEDSLKDQWKTHQRHLEDGQQRLNKDIQTANQELLNTLRIRLDAQEQYMQTQIGNLNNQVMKLQQVNKERSSGKKLALEIICIAVNPCSNEP